jgi:hypothetical protein
MDDTRAAVVELFWIPLGARGHSVRFNGIVYEVLMAAWQGRTRSDLCHAALVITVDGVRYTVEVAPSPDADEASRGVVATGPVGNRWLGWLRVFRYEVRCWPGGTIPDLRYAVDSPRIVTADVAIARRLLAVIPRVPTPVWGRDELTTGDMWNSKLSRRMDAFDRRSSDQGNHAAARRARSRVERRGHGGVAYARSRPRRVLKVRRAPRGYRKPGKPPLGFRVDNIFRRGGIVPERAQRSIGR